MNAGRLAGLDLLRLGAALAVVLFHFGYRGTAGAAPLSQIGFPELAGIAKYGFAGVDLFFMISGFVIAASAEGRTAARFAVARLARLYPAFIACMTLTALVIAIWGGPAHRAGMVQWLANLTMFAPALGQPFMDGAYWSIVMEIVFYGWVGLAVALGLFERRLLTIVLGWLGLCFLNTAVLHSKALGLLCLTEYGPYFASGILFHRLWRGDDRWQVWALLLGAAVLGAEHAYTIRSEFSRLYADTVDMGVLWSIHAGLYLTLPAALLASRLIAPTPAVLALGGLTYPLYLVHQNAGYIVLDRVAPVLGRWPALLIAFGLALATAWLIWRHAEPLGRTLIHRLTAALAKQFSRIAPLRALHA